MLALASRGCGHVAAAAAAAAAGLSPALSDGRLPSTGTGAQGRTAAHGEKRTRTTAASRRRDLGGT